MPDESAPPRLEDVIAELHAFELELRDLHARRQISRTCYERVVRTFHDVVSIAGR